MIYAFASSSHDLKLQTSNTEENQKENLPTLHQNGGAKLLSYLCNRLLRNYVILMGGGGLGYPEKI